MRASVSAFPGGILSLLARDTDIINAGCEYLDIIRFTYPVWCLTTVLLATQRSVENARIGFIVTLMSLFLNLLLNYCLIFGHLGFPELGIRGAAWACDDSGDAENARLCRQIGVGVLHMHMVGAPPSETGSMRVYLSTKLHIRDSVK